MAAVRASFAKLFHGSGCYNLRNQSHQRCCSYSNVSECTINTFYITKAWCPFGGSQFTKDTQNRGIFSAFSSRYVHNRNALFGGANAMFALRPYSSNVGRKLDEIGASASPIDNMNTDGSDWSDSLQVAYKSVLDASSYANEKAVEMADEIVPYVQQFLDLHPSLKTVIIPVGGTLSAALLAWIVMPKLLRKLHEYLSPGPFALLSGSIGQEQIPYKRSVWGALEDPTRYFITFMAFSQLAALIAPNSITSQHVVQAWRATFVLAFVWFLYRWKSSVFTHALATQSVSGLDRERLLALDKLSSLGLLVLGFMASAEACGVAVQSILTVGGIGGVATAFAARDILGNLLNGLSLQFSRPFSVGDTIKAGSIEGQVIEMGLTTTSLLSSEKFPITVPNSLFSSQAIVNKSRARWQAIVTKIPLQVNDLAKIPQVSEDVKSMLRLNPKVFIEKEAPYCYLSRIENSFAELTIGYNLRHMSREEMYSTQQDILLQSIQIIKKHGAELGSILQDWSSH
ncbi:mechanosensitive ion channel protein 1, mitochondrial-like [Aristolochia californica]|uniref:mechanosensitive ion channel protein 1, mitochondrial-like n=1 Tax=Aristolochia californica TaxID=171875 RepID=UPI0035E01B68